MSNQESSFAEPERRAYEARNINNDAREQQREYPQEYPPSYGGFGQQQQMGEKLRTPRTGRPRRLWLLLLLLVLILLVGGGLLSQVGAFASTQSSTQTHSIPSVSHPRLVIQDDNGAVHIHTGSGDSVTVTETKQVTGIGTVNLNDMHVDYAQNGDTIDITAKNGFAPFFLGDRSIDLDVTVPNTSDVVISSGSGEVEVDNITGQVKVETGSGSITANNLNGPITLKAGSGEIDAHNLDGPTTLQTGSGSITVGGLVGQANVNSGSGSVEITKAKLSGQSSVKTGSGSIEFTGSIDPAGSYQFETGSGEIGVTLPATSAFNLDVSTGSGSINNAFGSTTVGNDPRAALRLHTGSGDITLQKN